MGTVKTDVVAHIKVVGEDKAGNRFNKFTDKIRKSGININKVIEKTSHTFKAWSDIQDRLIDVTRKTTKTTNLLGKIAESRNKAVIANELMRVKMEENREKVIGKINKDRINKERQQRIQSDKFGRMITARMNKNVGMWYRQKKAMKRFHAEYLSAMFGFQAISRGMQALLSPSFEIVGVFELLATTLQIVFLPIALTMMDVLIPILSLFMDMPDSLKLALGALVVVIGGIAALGAVFFASKLFLQGFNDSIPMLSKLLESLGISTGTLATKTIDLKGALDGLASIAAISIGVALAKDAFDDFKEGNILDGIFKSLESAGLIGFSVGKLKGTSLIQLLIGAEAAKDMVEQIGAGNVLESIGDAFMVAGAALSWFIPGPFGAALFAIGFTLRFIKPIAEVATSVMDWIQENIVTPIKGRIAISQGKTPSIEYYMGRKKQSGGYIPQTGLYNLHAGEQVIPANQSFTSSPTININTTGGVDNFSLNQIQEIISKELSSISRR